jgi:hypothetical protein
MARKIFFSFHYERDAWRAGQVRNCNVVAGEDEYGFIDAVDWESIVSVRGNTRLTDAPTSAGNASSKAIKSYPAVS